MNIDNSDKDNKYNRNENSNNINESNNGYIKDKDNITANDN